MNDKKYIITTLAIVAIIAVIYTINYVNNGANIYYSSPNRKYNPNYIMSIAILSLMLSPYIGSEGVKKGKEGYQRYLTYKRDGEMRLAVEDAIEESHGMYFFLPTKIIKKYAREDQKVNVFQKKVRFLAPYLLAYLTYLVAYITVIAQLSVRWQALTLCVPLYILYINITQYIDCNNNYMAIKNIYIDKKYKLN